MSFSLGLGAIPYRGANTIAVCSRRRRSRGPPIPSSAGPSFATAAATLGAGAGPRMPGGLPCPLPRASLRRPLGSLVRCGPRAFPMGRALVPRPPSPLLALSLCGRALPLRASSHVGAQDPLGMHSGALTPRPKRGAAIGIGIGIRISGGQLPRAQGAASGRRGSLQPPPPPWRQAHRSGPPSTALAALKGNTQSPFPPDSAPSQLQILWRRTVRELASLPLALSLLFAIAGACALGTVIDQGAAPAEYLRDYPSDAPVLGFLTGELILALGLDHVYSNPLFLGLLLLLGACLSACTATRQLPMLKVARKWSFSSSPSGVHSLPYSEALPNARLADVGVELSRRGFEVFREGNSLYGFKGLAGRLAPIGVHAAMILVMVGGTYSALGGFHGSVMIPQGLQVEVPEALQRNSPVARPTSGMSMLLQLDSFRIDYRPNGEVSQFYSDLRMLDYTGGEIMRKTISVNDPLRCQGVTVYQTDWAISALQLRVDGQDPLKLPMAALPDPSGSSAKLYGTFLPLSETPQAPQVQGAAPRGITVLARDLQSVVLYDAEGKFVGVRRPGSRKPIAVEGRSVVVEDIIGSSGLELKVDPGVPVVYTGFGFLMLTTFISYLSHSQVWALQEGSTVHVGGRTNRAKYVFQDELNEIADSIPEIVDVNASASVNANATGNVNGIVNLTKNVAANELPQETPHVAG